MSNRRPVEIESITLLSILKKAEHFTAGLDNAGLGKLAAIAVPEEYDTNAILTQEDERARDLFIIVKGSISVEMNLTHDTPPVSILKIRDGETVGELSFLDGARRSASLKAVVPTSVIRLPYDKMDELFNMDNGTGLIIMRNLAKLVTQRLRDANFGLRYFAPKLE